MTDIIKQQIIPPTGTSLSDFTGKAPINWQAMIVLVGSPIISILGIPLYLHFYEISTAAWVICLLLLLWGGISITAGYHRLWAHRTYQASLPLQVFLLFGGTMAMQNSVLFWSAGHRLHHRNVDHVDLDPYSAKRGFWFSHIGWMLHDYPSGYLDYSNAPDLINNKLVIFQHKYYNLCVLFTSIVFIAFLGWLVGDLWGVLLIAGVLRLVISHHGTFFINSLAHMYGTQPYSDENTARDNFWLALLTFGEGYHNYHHIFQNDFRNGVKWWQFDPTKWFIIGMSKIGLATHLKTTPEFTIRKAEAAMTFKRAQQSLAAGSVPQGLMADLEALKARLITEYDAFTQTVNEWTALREKAFDLRKAAISDKIVEMDRRLKLDFKAQEMRMQQHVLEMKSMLMSIRKLVKVKIA